MKKNLITLLYAVFLVASVNIPAQEVTANKTLENIFEYSKSKNYESAAVFLAYDGVDENRKFKDTFNSKEKSELKIVRRKLKKIKALIDISDNYEFGKTVKKKKDGVDLFIQPVVFNSGNQKLTTNFEFIKIKGKFALADID
ncbi:MAG: hypothetical protein PVH88_13500 [Ignavibacteria bacterium]|jgi:hypothetical protein